MVKARAKTLPPEEVLRSTKEPDFRQERSRKSFVALLDAATELFAKHGYDAVGTPEIAQHAGVSVGTFYRYFEDKQEIYVEISRRSMLAAYNESIGSMTAKDFIGKSRTETIAVAVAKVLDNVLSRPELSRSFTEMSLRDPQVAELRRAVEELSVARLAQLISAVVPRSAVPDPEATAFVLYATVMECAYSLVTPFRPPIIPAERIKTALTTFIERALFG